MAKPKLAERLEIAKAKESYEKSKRDTSRKNKGKKDDEQTEEIVTVTNEDLKNKEKQDEKETELKNKVSEKQKNTEEEPKELTKLEKKKAREAKREAKKAKKEALKEAKLRASNEEEENEENDDGEPIIEVASLDKEFQKDFASVVAVDHEEDDEEEADNRLELEKLAKSDNEEEEEEDDDEEEDEDDDEEEEDVAYSDVEFDSDADIVPHTKVTINKTAALEDSYNRIRLPWDKYPFTEHQSITSKEAAVDSIKDIYDDTERELSFYKQGLSAVVEARSTLVKMKVPFSRPSDYFAEMLKSDEHMDKLKQKLIKEATAAKKSEDAKKQRLLKKFGKKVQIETLQERQKQKRETLEKIKSFRKKKGSNAGGSMNDDEFDIAIEESNAAKDEYNRKRKFKSGGPGANGDRKGGSKKTKRPGKSKRGSRR